MKQHRHKHLPNRRKKTSASKKTKINGLARALKAIGIAVGVILLLQFLVYLIAPSLFYRAYYRLTGSYRPEENEQFDGIDVSHHNGRINWPKVKENPNIQFVYIKATEGYRHPDKLYPTNITNARKAGLKAGSYHLLTTLTSIQTQYDYFRSIISDYDQDLIPMIDIEEDKVRRWSKQQLKDSLQVFIRLIKADYGVEPVIYCSHRFYNSKLAPDFDCYTLFIARYSRSAPSLDSRHKHHDIWQFSEHGQVKGINGEVDLSRFGPDTELQDILLK